MHEKPKGNWKGDILGVAIVNTVINPKEPWDGTGADALCTLLLLYPGNSLHLCPAD